jgi:hypothetical protein
VAEYDRYQFNQLCGFVPDKTWIIRAKFLATVTSWMVKLLAWLNDMKGCTSAVYKIVRMVEKAEKESRKGSECKEVNKRRSMKYISWNEI